MEKMLLYTVDGMENLGTIWSNITLGIYLLALVSTISALVMYVKDLYKKGFIEKSDLKKEVTVDKKN